MTGTDTNKIVGQYRGWLTGILKNEFIQLHIVPQLGGRIMQLAIDGYEFFFVNNALAGKESDETRLGVNGEWLNFGGEKIWPAPQGWDTPNQWPGPPDSVLDSGIYSIKTSDDAATTTKVTLVSPFDTYTGLQIERDIILSDDKPEVTIKASFKNKSNTPKSWSVWPVCQMNTSDLNSEDRYQIVCPANPKSIFTNGYKVMHGLVNNPQYKIDNGNLIVDYKYLVGKAGLDTHAGWAAFVDKQTGKTLILRFNCPEGYTYPEDTTFQIWTQGKGMIYSRNTVREFKNDKDLTPPYMEMEILSPLQEIPAGQCIEFNYSMSVSTIPANKTVTNIKETGIIANPITQHSGKKGTVIQAGYGFFSKGSLKIMLRKKQKEEKPQCIYEESISPYKGTEIELLLEEDVLNGKALLTAEVYDKDGRYRGEIDRIKLK